jgi:hypothetical protein
MSSSPAPSADRSSVRAMPAVQGHGPDPSGVGVRADRAVPCERAGDPGLLEGVREVAR